MITLYPAIDLQDGRAVRLRQGDFAQTTVFSEDPVDQARRFAEDGATSLHVVDLDGARAGEPVHAALVASIAAAFPGTVHLGGGLRSRAAIETALATGVDRVVVGTAVIDDRELLAWAVDRLGDGLVVAARAADGTVEAIEGPSFALGVQWHAETLADGRLFEALVGASAPALRIAA
jgi:phosphoribosylformimino-5-aminoimidazole carboxamide ribotide isomerase